MPGFTTQLCPGRAFVELSAVQRLLASQHVVIPPEEGLAATLRTTGTGRAQLSA